MGKRFAYLVHDILWLDLWTNEIQPQIMTETKFEISIVEEETY